MENWKRVSRGHDELTERMLVPGGWIYRTIIPAATEAGSPGVAMVFVPDQAGWARRQPD